MTKFVTLLALFLSINTAWAAGGITTGGDGTAKARGATPAVTDKGMSLLGIRNDAGVPMSGADGLYTPITVDSTGRLRVDGTISEVGTAADGAAAPAQGKLVGGVDGLGNFQYFLVDTAGALSSNILSLPGGLQGYAEDAVHVSGDVGAPLLAVRDDAGTALAADGDYHLLTVDSTGRLRVDATTSEVATAADGGALPALTKVASGYDGANVQVLHTDATGDLQVDLASALPAGTNNIGDVDVLTLPSIPAGNNNIGDVDVVSQPARSHTTDSIAIGDGTDLALVTAAGELNVADANTRASVASIDGKLATLGQKAMAGSAPVVIASDQSTLNVAVASALPAGNNNIGDVDVASLPALPAGTNNIGDVDVLTLPALPAGTNNIGDVDVLTEPATAADAAAGLPAVTKVVAGYDGTNVQAIKTDSTGRLETVVAGNATNTNGSQTTSTVSTVITLTAPANAVGFILQAADTNTANLRYRIGAVATAASGQQLQPGRDSGYVPAAASISLVAESGTQEYEVQWILTN